jgi:hypoxanthine-DNA glycosylase
MIEVHPFGIFVPVKAKYLLLGSFIAKKPKDNSYDWYYSKKQNQFWPILEKIYNLELKNKKAKQDLFEKLGIAIADIIYQCERKYDNSLDSSLTNCVYNVPAIAKVLSENPIEKIFFTSRFVEKEFKKEFKELIDQYPDIELITLPSPSPRYAAMSKAEKIKKYLEHLPGLCK